MTTNASDADNIDDDDKTGVPCDKEKLPPDGADVGVILRAATDIRMLPVARDLHNIIISN